MRLVAIIMLVLCFNLSNALYSTVHLFTTEPVTYENELISNLNSTVSNSQYLGSNVQTEASAQIGVGDFIGALWYFVKIFFTGVLLPYKMLVNFHVDANIAMFLTIPIYLVYMVAVIAFIRGGYIE